MTDTPWRDESRLYDLYWEDGLDQGEIADELGCSRSTVKKWFNKHGLETRTQSEVVRLAHKKQDDDSPWRDKETLEKLYYEERMSLSEIASELGCGDEDVRRWMKKHGLERRSLSESHKTLTSSLYTNTSGYTIACSSNKMDESADEVPIHRLVAVAERGYNAVADKEIHHKNGVKWDNRPENLQLLSSSEHMKIEAEKQYDIEDTSYRKKETLYELYVSQQKSIREIADQFGVCGKTIQRWLKKNDIDRNSVEGGRKSTHTQGLGDF